MLQCNLSSGGMDSDGRPLCLIGVSALFNRSEERNMVVFLSSDLLLLYVENKDFSLTKHFSTDITTSKWNIFTLSE